MIFLRQKTKKKPVDFVQEEIQSHEEAEKKLQDQVQSLTTDVETHHGQLLACRQQIEQLKLERDSFYKGSVVVISF